LKISIFGMGYVGCVGLGCLAKNGHKVLGVDLNMAKVEAISRGESPIVENEIDEIIKEQHLKGTVSATNDNKMAVLDSDVSFICVGTPSTPNGHLNLNAIFSVAEEIGKAIKQKDSFHTIVIRSTVLPGTNEKTTDIIEQYSSKKRNEDFTVISNPEFLREGTAVKDYFNPSYTLIGSENERGIEVMKEVYGGIDAPVIITEVRVAEIMKYVNNAFHAQKISFANEVGNICKKLSIDSHKIMEIFCMDKKLNISPYYLKPGFAYGGSCLPKDLKALKTIAHDFYLDCPVLEAVDRSNEYQKKIVYDQIIEFKKEKVGFLGLSFKAGTDDLRNSPILDIIERLLGKGFDIKIYDQNVHFAQLVGANKEYILSKIPFISKFLTDDPDSVVDGSDVLVVVNESPEFSDILNNVDSGKIVYDLVNIEFDNKQNLKNYNGISW
jgi:GDP-mannose 6-dehydrogenase